jgi:hypothetical protein
MHGLNNDSSDGGNKNGDWINDVIYDELNGISESDSDSEDEDLEKQIFGE